MGQEHDGRATISLCLIVRDEADSLPRFLEHVRGFWDELCVVDTGSRDATRELVRAAGAKLVERPWDDDFSAARNASLALATGAWIVVLDPDELPSALALAELKAIAADAEAGAATVHIVNPLAGGLTQEAHILRMFRNDPTIRFEHRVHEMVDASVAAYLTRTGLALRHSEGPIEHLGYLRERAAARGKKDRDRALLERAIAEDRNDFYSHFKLLELARFWNDEALAGRAALACQAALDRVGPDALTGKPWGGDLVTLLGWALHRNDAAAALALLRTFEPHVVPSATLHLRRGEWQERTGEADGAAESFRACIELGDTAPNRDIATVRPLMGLARLALVRPRGLEEAWALTEQALLLNPRDAEALLCATSICRMAGGARLVDEFVREYTGKFGATPELARALAPAP